MTNANVQGDLCKLFSILKTSGELPKEMHPVPELDNRSGATIKLLLTRLGVDRLLQDIDCGEAKDVGSKSKLKVFGLKAGAASPFSQQFGDDVTPRSHYDWRDSGDKGETFDLPTKGFLNQFLRTLFGTKVNVISRQNKSIRLETKVQNFIHRQKSVIHTRREFALLEWKPKGDEADGPE